jgi:hypothetical protein
MTDRKTVVDFSVNDHIIYIQNEQAHDRSHAIDAPKIRTHVEYTGSAIYKSELLELVGSDLTPSTWMHCEPPPGDCGRANRYFSNALCPTGKTPEQITDIIAIHAQEQEEALKRFAKHLTDLSKLLLEIRAHQLAITPG